MKRSIFRLCSALTLIGLAACAHRGAANPDMAASADTLTAYHWQLEQAATAKPVQLTFAGQRLTVSGLCNVLGAGYKIDGPQMTVQQVVGTLRMCPDQALMKTEQEIGTRLEKIQSWNIAGAAPGNVGVEPVLTLKFNDGGQWLLKGKPTDESKYGSSGETVYLEIQPQLAPCNHPLIPNKQCMKVRTVEYDESGIKQKLGAWELFYSDIEGYQHDAGVRNILRVKRYTIANPPADASRYAYVLDMVVESERKQ